MIQEISGVDDPANLHPGWILMKAREAGVDPDEVAAELELIVRAHSALHESLTAAAGFLADAPDDVKAAAEKLSAYITEMEAKTEDEEDGMMKERALRIARAASGDILFSSDMSLDGLRQDVHTALRNAMPGGSNGLEAEMGCYVSDIMLDDSGGAALIYHGGAHYLARFTNDDEGNVALDDRMSWTELEQVWVAKIAVPHDELPVVAGEPATWDPAAALARVRQWAAGDEALMQKAYVARGTGTDLLIADVIDNELVAVPAAIFAAAHATNRIADEQERSVVRDHLSKYYERIERTAPWNEEGWKTRVQRLLGLNKQHEVVNMSRADLELFIAAHTAIVKDSITQALNRDDTYMVGSKR